ncbi:fungal cellulose binding domain-containing protein [Phlyctema vagabunda]|uniref:AA9 family lytic polysaccharide monooxygenase n=1 Tax=Phlyctema vagabunda TaxID=108571 RepID=A0ABR4PRQ0_9HELO
MKGLAGIFVGFTALATNASAHYIFNTLTANGVKNSVYQYIRPNTNNNSPVIDLASNDLRCNVGATGSSTQTVAVAAGSSVSFTSDVAVYHQGPLSVYMAKAPSTAAAFDGSGNVWFKILDIGPTFSNGAATWDLKQTYTFNLPTCIPSGEYLLRVQQLAIHNPWPAGIPQFYIECAQISVTGGGSKDLGPKVAIPGAFKETDPGYTVNIYNGFTNYTVPGPAVATC